MPQREKFRQKEDENFLVGKYQRLPIAFFKAKFRHVPTNAHKSLPPFLPFALTILPLQLSRSEPIPPCVTSHKAVIPRRPHARLDEPRSSNLAQNTRTIPT